MAKKKPIVSFSDAEIIFELEGKTFRLVHLDPNTMEVSIKDTQSKKEHALPFAHLPKAVKKKIRPL